jgi:succinate dehydrogenase/fumarate reductase cytochrome b subunit
LEFGVYGLITYSSILMLIISVIKEIPDTKSGAVSRAIFLLPGAICALILAFSGEVIVTSATTNTIVALNTTEAWTETIASTITLQNPIWVSVHFLFFIVIVVHMLNQVVNLITRKD